MSMYLSNPDVRPTGYEPAEFIDAPEPARPERKSDASPVSGGLDATPDAGRRADREPA
jgi:hypothetical protein